jgi:hypothetical protein
VKGTIFLLFSEVEKCNNFFSVRAVRVLINNSLIIY